MPALLLWLTPLLLLAVQALRLWLRVRAGGGLGGEAEAAALRAERAAVEAAKLELHPVRDFVAVSKLGRKLVALDRSLAAAAAARRAAAAAPAAALPVAWAHHAAVAAVAAAGWGARLAPLPAGWLSPVAWLLSVGAGPGSARAGALGALPWALLCSAVAEAALTGAARAAGVLPAPPPAGGWLTALTGSDAG